MRTTLFLMLQPLLLASHWPTCDAFVVPPRSSRPARSLLFSSTVNNDAVSTSTTTTTTLTQRIMEQTLDEQQSSGAGGASTYAAFQRTCQNWERLKQQNTNPIVQPTPMFVSNDGAQGNGDCWQALRDVANNSNNDDNGKQPLDYDVVVCGGTLGIFFACQLQLLGHQVCVLEAGPLRGRAQEWNISLDELRQLVQLGILTPDDIENVITTRFPGCRSGFKNQEITPLQGGYFDNGNVGFETFTENVLNLGVSPSSLLEKVAKKFQSLGGTLLERTPIAGICVSASSGAAIDLVPTTKDSNAPKKKPTPITCRLVLDCMGNNSPISRQQRGHPTKPDGVCCVVGSCASGYDADTNRNGDIIYTFDTIQDKQNASKLQYFWEAFPVGIGVDGVEKTTKKTTYMFTYLDADARRPSLETIMDDYWRQLPMYQPSITNPETDLDVHRVLCAYFPTFTDSPLQPQWDRVLAVGDASGIQSPLSFGGFGALSRHLGRIGTAVDEALREDLLDREHLGAINPYTPNLSATWMFQKAMSVRVGQTVDPKFVNRLLAVNFECMDNMGKRTILPFLQDVVRFDGLIGSLARSFVTDPTFMPEIVAHVGVPRLISWLGHVANMALYDLLHKVATPVVSSVVENGVIKDPSQQYMWRRRMDAWEYGSGNDYQLPAEN